MPPVDIDASDNPEAIFDRSAESNITLSAELAAEIARLGAEMGLPYIAATVDISDPSPMCDAEGQLLAKTVFRWLDPELAYWENRSFALESGFILAVRHCAEPFYFHQGQLHSWRPTRVLDAINATCDYDDYGVVGGIIVPCHLTNGVIGVVLWATDDPSIDTPAVFERFADRAHMLTLKFLSVHKELKARRGEAHIVQLSRREIRCLKWAAAGKTDAEIAMIIDISKATVRFHLTNVYRKLGVTSRAQAVSLATSLGYVGTRS